MSNPAQDLDLDPRDAALQAHTPTVMAPHYGDLEPLQEFGHRHIVAKDGLWLEVLQPWIWTRMHLAPARTPLPYGRIEPEMEHWLSVDDLDSITRLFIRYAQSQLPNECAAIGVYNVHTQELELRPLEATSASPGHVKYTRPALSNEESLAVDLHSHGAGMPFFSAQDDLDDAGEVKLSIVVGCVNEYEYNYSHHHYMHDLVLVRWCIRGLFEPANYLVAP